MSHGKAEACVEHEVEKRKKSFAAFSCQLGPKLLLVSILMIFKIDFCFVVRSIFSRLNDKINSGSRGLRNLHHYIIYIAIIKISITGNSPLGEKIKMIAEAFWEETRGWRFEGWGVYSEWQEKDFSFFFSPPTQQLFVSDVNWIMQEIQSRISAISSSVFSRQAEEI